MALPNDLTSEDIRNFIKSPLWEGIKDMIERRKDFIYGSSDSQTASINFGQVKELEYVTRVPNMMLKEVEKREKEEIEKLRKGSTLNSEED